MVARLFNYLQVPHLHATHREIWNLKLELNRDTAVLLALLGLNGGETETCPHRELLAAGELLDEPYHAVCVWDISDSTHICLEDW